MYTRGLPIVGQELRARTAMYGEGQREDMKPRGKGQIWVSKGAQDIAEGQYKHSDIVILTPFQ